MKNILVLHSRWEIEGVKVNCIKFSSYNVISLLIVKCNQSGIWHLCELKYRAVSLPIPSAVTERRSQSWFLALTSREPLNVFVSFIKLDCRTLKTLVWSSIINYKPRFELVKLSWVFIDKRSRLIVRGISNGELALFGFFLGSTIDLSGAINYSDYWKLQH